MRQKLLNFYLNTLGYSTASGSLIGFFHGLRKVDNYNKKDNIFRGFPFIYQFGIALKYTIYGGLCGVLYPISVPLLIYKSERELDVYFNNNK